MVGLALLVGAETAGAATCLWIRPGSYTVSPTSRFTIDSTAIVERHDESFGADIQVTHGVPIIERSMYWDSNGFQFSGGTNATGSRLP
jgi:hypothetical protein